MRHDYPLTDETEKVIKPNVQAVALEMDVSDKYLYAILSEERNDPFSIFEHMSKGAARAGAAVCLWDNKLAAIRTRYQKTMPDRTLIQCLAEKIEGDADTTARLVDALQDGQIDANEANTIQAAIDKERSTLDLLEIHLNFKRSLKAVGGKS